jgi:hypothetical protein
MTIVRNGQVIAGYDRRHGIPPSNCTNLYYVKTGTSVALNWKDPDDTVIDGFTLCTWLGTKIIRKAGSVPQHPGDGTEIVDIRTRNQYQVTPLEDTLPSDSVTYYYRAFPYSDHFVFNLDPTTSVFGALDYAFTIDMSDSNPFTRVAYYENSAARNFKPAKMDYANGYFDWGSHKDAWFLPKPCMLHCGNNSSSTEDYVDYYLNPNNYAQKMDGSASDYNNTSYSGNVMLEFPQVWQKYEQHPDNVNKVIVHLSNRQIDNDYHCYTHYNKDGDLVPYVYRGAYDGSYISNRTRCISGQATGNNVVASTEVQYAQANGAYWYTDVLCDRLMINNLLMFMGLSTDSQTTFGNGHYTGGSSASSLLYSGRFDDKGLFWGTNGTGSAVKVLGMENWWGNVWLRTAGYINANGVQKIKLKPNTNDGSTATAYNYDGTGYITLDSAYNLGTNSEAYITRMACIPPYGLFPYGTYSGGSSSTYFCDGIWSNTTQVNYVESGGSCSHGFIDGFSAIIQRNATSSSFWTHGSSLTCKPKLN